MPSLPELSADDRRFFGHPRGLSTLFFTEMWERFSYYGMRAFLILYMTTPAIAGGLGMADSDATSIYGTYTGSAWGASILGGVIGDRWLGQYHSVLIGGTVIMLGHFALAFPAVPFFYAGLALIVMGTGLLKPNVSTLVGSLYTQSDARRDTGFSIFYMGINVGALLGPLVAGYIAQRIDWHLGFACAGVGMALGLTQLAFGRKYLRGAVDRLAESRTTLAGSPAGDETLALKRSGPLVSGDEWKRIAAIAVFFVFGALFFAGYEQAGSSLTLFADRHTQLEVFGWSFPSSWFNSVQPIWVIILTPIFAWTWTRLGASQPSISGKFALGLFFMGLGFLLLYPAAGIAQGDGLRVSPWWLVFAYMLSEFGEICLYPVGMSAVTKLSPPRIVGLMMGVWFLSLGVGNKLAGWLAGFIESMPFQTLFLIMTAALIGAAVVMALLITPVSRLTGEAK